MQSLINNKRVDPVFVIPGAREIDLRIGEARPGECRHSILSIREARLLAYVLLATAEDIEAERAAVAAGLGLSGPATGT